MSEVPDQEMRRSRVETSVPAWPGRLRDLSISSKLALMVLVMVAVNVALLAMVVITFTINSGVRAYVGGEGLWSKGQKDAVYYLVRYSQSHDDRDYARYRQAIAIPLGDSRARQELRKDEYDEAVVREGFLAGGNDIADIPAMIFLFRHFHDFSYLARAIDIWTRADVYIEELARYGEELRAPVAAGPADTGRQQEISRRLEAINRSLTPLEREFSAVLGEGARRIRGIMLATIFAAAAGLLGGGLWVSWRISRELRWGILNLREGAIRATEGDLDHSIEVRSRDELGDLATVFNTMISHRKETETSLRRAHEFREKVMQSASNAIFAFDLEGRFVLVNQRVADITGYSQEELLGSSFARLIPPERLADVAAQFEIARTGSGSARNYETPIVRKDGNVVVITFSNAPLTSGGRVMGVVGTAEDVTERRRVERALEKEREFLKTLMDSLADRIVACDESGRLTIHSSRPGTSADVVPPEAWAEHFGLYSADGMTLLPRDEVPLYRALQGEAVQSFEMVRAPKGRPSQVVLVNGRPILTPAGQKLGAVVVMHDITERKLAERELAIRASELVRLNRIHALLSNVSSLIVRVTDTQELLEEACRIAVTHGGFRMAAVGQIDADAAEGRAVAWAGQDLGYVDSVSLTTQPGLAHSDIPESLALRNRQPVVCNDLGQHEAVRRVYPQALMARCGSVAAFPLLVDGSAERVLVLFAEETGSFHGEELVLLNALIKDIVFALEYLHKEEKLRFLTNFDPLTGLANQDLLLDRLQQRLPAAGREFPHFSLGVLEVDRLEVITATLGRSAADALLGQVAHRLLGCLADPGRVARVGPNTFAIMLTDVADGDAERAAMIRRILAIFDAPFRIDGNELRFGGRLGVAASPDAEMDAQRLLRNAERALHASRHAGEPCMFYTRDLDARPSDRFARETALRHAVERREFVLYYQPKIDIAHGKIVGSEALVRWASPDGRLVPPSEFIPLLEETGMILEVGRWALQQAAADLERIAVACAVPHRVAVNVSQAQLRHRDFIADMRRAREIEGRNATSLDIEITESLMMYDIEGNIQKLSAIRELGMGIAIDDFGTGYSSLAYLGRLPVTAVKIDRSFVSGMSASSSGMTLVSTIISLANSLKLKVIAEGVETEEQLNILKLLRCDECQGFLYSPAVPLERLIEMLAARPH